jgi:hypothetical protein
MDSLHHLSRIYFKYNVYRHTNTRSLSPQGNGRVLVFLSSSLFYYLPHPPYTPINILWISMSNGMLAVPLDPFDEDLDQIRCLGERAEMEEDEKNALWVFLALWKGFVSNTIFASLSTHRASRHSKRE